MFSLESIYGPCTAIPYKTTSNQINATEWVIIQPRREWYEIFYDYMKKPDTKDAPE